MKNNLLTSMFVCLLFLSTLASCFLMYKYNTSMQRVLSLQPKAAEVTRVMGIMQSLVNDTIEYGRTTKNPDMAHLLQSMNTAPTAKPAAKPAAK